MSIFFLAAAAAAAAATPVATPAAPPARGYEAQMTASGRVCLRPTTAAEGVRLDIPLRRQECRPMAQWEDGGLRFHRDGDRI